MDVWDDQQTMVVRSSRVTLPPWAELILWCDGSEFSGIHLWWEGVYAEPELFPNVVYLDYSYQLDHGDFQTAYWGWLGSKLEYHADPMSFLAEIRAADTLFMRLEDADPNQPFEVTFNLEGIEWAIAQLPCIE